MELFIAGVIGSINSILKGFNIAVLENPSCIGKTLTSINIFVKPYLLLDIKLLLVG